MGEPAASQHDAAGGVDLQFAFRGSHDGARHLAGPVGEQVPGRRGDADLHAEVIGGLQQPAGERGPVDQLHVAAVREEVQECKPTRQAA